MDTRRRSANAPTAVNGTFNISKIYRSFGAATLHLTCFAWRVCKYDRKTSHPRVHSPPAAARPLAPGGRPWQQRHRRQRQRGEKGGREEGCSRQCQDPVPAAARPLSMPHVDVPRLWPDLSIWTRARQRRTRADCFAGL